MLGCLNFWSRTTYLIQLIEVSLRGSTVSALLLR
jgi:hypothetical protein